MVIGIGFCGVLMIVCLGLLGFNVYLLFVLVGVGCMVLCDFVICKLLLDVLMLGVVLIIFFVVILLGFGLIVVNGW